MLKSVENPKGKSLPIFIAVFVAFWIWMGIDPYNRFDWLLENLLIFACIGALTAAYPRFRFTDVSYGLITLFLMLHTLGAHYSYNTTPIDTLLHRLFQLRRDDFDRIVHCCFGLLMAYPILELMERIVKLRGWRAYVLTVTAVLAGGAFYELIEMWVAKLVAPEIGDLFLGTQGDVWDSQHDMEVALYGAAAAMAITAIVRMQRGSGVR